MSFGEIVMPRIILKEKITKEIEIPMDTLYEVIDSLTEEERTKLFRRIKLQTPVWR
jgi:hypothetical protein